MGDAEDQHYGQLCQRIGCEHTRASHLNGICDWCGCLHFLDPDHDDEPDARIAVLDRAVKETG